jgi:predicted RNase H-like nuclease
MYADERVILNSLFGNYKRSGYNVPFVAGMKSCRYGWVVVTVEFDQEVVSEEHHLFSTIREALSLFPRPGIFAVSVPIGLLDESAKGGRECDRQARKILGTPRGNSIFSPPSRSSLNCSTFEQALSSGLNRQSLAILPRVLEMDQVINPERQSWIKEAHPELSFYVMDGLRPMEERRKTIPGRKARMDLLKRFFHQVEEGSTRFTRKDVSPDDVLDAYAAAWTAMRVFKGEAGCIPENPIYDSKGVEMAIWY